MVSGTDREFNAYLYLWNLEKFSLILSHTPSTALLFSVDYISFSPMFRIRIICSHPIVPTLHNLTPHSYSTFLLHNLTSHSYSTTLHHILTPQPYITFLLHILTPHLYSTSFLHIFSLQNLTPQSLHILLHNHPISNSLPAGDARHLYNTSRSMPYNSSPTIL